MVSSSKKSEVISKEGVREFKTPSSDFDGTLILIVHRIVNHSEQSFHAKDEEVKGYGVTLPNSSSRLELVSRFTIDKNRYGGTTTIGHDMIYHARRKMEKEESIPNVRPL